MTEERDNGGSAETANEKIVHRFYGAFQKLDAKTMNQCYAPDATFSDPVFPNLKSSDCQTMWSMLTTRARKFELSYCDIQEVEKNLVEAHWEAHYDFSATGRRVHNVIDASIRLRDGFFVEHVDRFDLWRWSRQALGPVGLLLGWSPVVRSKIRRQAAAGLQAFASRESLG